MWPFDLGCDLGLGHVTDLGLTFGVSGRVTLGWPFDPFAATWERCRTTNTSMEGSCVSMVTQESVHLDLHLDLLFYVVCLKIDSVTKSSRTMLEAYLFLLILMKIVFKIGSLLDCHTGTLLYLQHTWISILRYSLTFIGIPITKIRRSHDRLLFIMWILKPGKMVFILKQGPVAKRWNVD